MPKFLALGAEVAIAFLVPREVGPRPSPVRALGLVENRDEGKDLPLQRQPDEVLFRTVGRVGRQPVRAEAKTPFGLRRVPSRARSLMRLRLGSGSGLGLGPGLGLGLGSGLGAGLA